MDVFTDSRGSLAVLNVKDVPFTIKRVFFIYDTPANSIRGKHYHKIGEQCLYLLKGACAVKITPINTKITKIIPLKQFEGFYLPTYTGIEMMGEGYVLMVVCNNEYDPGDAYDY